MWKHPYVTNPLLKKRWISYPKNYLFGVTNRWFGCYSLTSFFLRFQDIQVTSVTSSFFHTGNSPWFFLKKHKTPKRRRQVTGAKLRSSCGARKHSEVSTFMAEAEARPHVPPRIQRSVWGPPCTDNWCFGMFWLYNIIITGDKFPGNYRTYPTKREVWKIIFKSDFLMGYVSSLKGTIYNW